MKSADDLYVEVLQLRATLAEQAAEIKRLRYDAETARLIEEHLHRFGELTIRQHRMDDGPDYIAYCEDEPGDGTALGESVTLGEAVRAAVKGEG